MTIQIDKITHALACYAITLTAGLFLTWWVALIIAVEIGALKEFLDWITKKGSPEWLDFLADVIGALIGALILIIA